MIICKTLDEARKVDGVIHIESGAVIIAYQVIDELPDHCKTPDAAAEPSEIEQLKERIAALEAKS